MSKTQEADACGHCGRSKHAGGQQCPASDRNCRRYGKKGHYDTKKADNAGGASGSSTKVVAIRAHPSKVGRQRGEMFRPVRIGAIQVVASDRTKEAPRIKVIVESSDKVNVIEMLPDTGADICAGDPEFLEQMDGHENNLIDTNVRIRAEIIANVSQIGLGIVQQRRHADGGWTTIKAGSRHSKDTVENKAGVEPAESDVSFGQIRMLQAKEMPLRKIEIADANGGHSPAQKLFGRPIREQDALNRTRREENGRNRKWREQDARNRKRREQDGRNRRQSDDDARMRRGRRARRRRKSITAGGGGGRRDAESANPTLTPEQQADAAISDFGANVDPDLGANIGPPKTIEPGAVGASKPRRSERASKPPERLLDEPYGPE